MDHKTAFELAYGPLRKEVKRATTESRESASASKRAAACIRACEGLSIRALDEGGIAELIEAAQLAQRVLGGRLARIDPEATIAEASLRQALRKVRRWSA